TNAGGPGILAVDACEAAGLTIAPLASATCSRLAAFLPPEASVGNPVDMVASATPDAYRQAIGAALAPVEVDALIVIYKPGDPLRAEETLRGICDGIAGARRAGAAGKPVVACLMTRQGRQLPLDIQGERVPAYPFPENAARALARAAQYAEWRAQPPALYWTF